jgi:hypothetical protein
MKLKWNSGVRISSEVRMIFNDAVSVTEAEGFCDFIYEYLFSEGTLFRFKPG